MNEARLRPRRRRIAVITGTRAEYGALLSTMRAIHAHPRLELQVIATGMHLLSAFGRTLDVIRRDGWKPIAVRMQRGDDSPLDQSVGLARGVEGIARALDKLDSDIAVVLGDRIEAMAGALATVTSGRILAHIHGGDVASGDFDDSLRHAITKLAHVHLVASAESQRRVLRMGEARDRVHRVGAPGLDELAAIRAELPARRGRSGFALVVQHAYGRAAGVEHATMRRILDEVARRGLRRVIIHPNSDRGFHGVLQAIETHAGRHPDEVEVHRSLPRETYLRTLLAAEVLIGNSSSGIIEAPFAGTPSINVGDRQRGRETGGASVLHARESGLAIRAALAKALANRTSARRRPISSNYGDGHSGARIAALLVKTPLTDAFRRKAITY